MLGIRRNWTWTFDIKTLSRAHEGQYVGGERGHKRQQVFLHDQLTDKSRFNGDHHGQNGAVYEPDHTVCGYLGRQDWCRRTDVTIGIEALRRAFGVRSWL